MMAYVVLDNNNIINSRDVKTSLDHNIDINLSSLRMYDYRFQYRFRKIIK